MNDIEMKKNKKNESASKKSSGLWSQQVTEHSNALDLEEGVFTRSPKEIALSLKRSAEKGRRRKASPFRSAMSMLIFYKNRAGSRLTQAQKDNLEAAKDELRRLFDK